MDEGHKEEILICALLYRLCLNFEGFKWKEYMIPFMREQGSKVSSALTQKRLPAQLSGKTRV